MTSDFRGRGGSELGLDTIGRSEGGYFEIWTSAGHVQRTLRTVRGGGVFLKDGRVFRIAGEGGDL